MTVVVFSDAAQADLEVARQFYAERSAPQAARFAAEIDKAVARIVFAPEAWPRVAPRLRRYVVRHFPYLILFHVRADGGVLIAAVAHQRQNPSTYLRR